MAQQNWFYKTDGGQHGPVSGRELKRLVSIGEIKADDLVRRESMEKWVRAESVKGLIASEAVDSPPPLPKKNREPEPETAGTPSLFDKLKSSAGGVAETTRAVGGVVARQAEITRIKTIDLPKLFADLGKEVLNQQLVQPDLPELCDQIEQAKKQIDEAEETASQIGSSAREIARKAKHKAKVKALQVQQSKLLRDLGEQAFAYEHVRASCEEKIGKIEEIRRRLDELQQANDRADTESKSRVFTIKRIAFVAITCFGLMLLLVAANVLQSVTQSLVGVRPDSVVEVSEFDFSEIDYTAIPSGATTAKITRIVEQGEGLDELIGSPLEAQGYRTSNGDFIHHGKQVVWSGQAKSTVRVESWFCEGTQHGPYLRWHKDGSKAVEAAIVEGQWHGASTRWNPEGVVVERTPYKHGKLHGITQKFFADGSLLEEAGFKDGLSHGEIQRWHDKDQIAMKSGFIDGKKHGVVKFWDRDGNVILEGKCEHGAPKGIWKFPFNDRYTQEQYFVSIYSKPWHGGTIAEFISKLRLLHFMEDGKSDMFPREGRAHIYASSIEAFHRIVGIPDVDMTRDPGTNLENYRRYWAFYCSDGAVTLKIAVDPRSGVVNCQTVNE